MLFHNLIFNDLLNDIFLDQRLDRAEFASFVNTTTLKFTKDNIPAVNTNGGWSRPRFSWGKRSNKQEMWLRAEMTVLRV